MVACHHPLADEVQTVLRTLFLDRICTHILAFEGESQAVFFEGNYQEYEADRHRRLGAEADQPHRIKYRKLVS